MEKWERFTVPGNGRVVVSLRMFALIVCAQHCCNINATVICHASLHVLVTIDWSRR